MDGLDSVRFWQPPGIVGILWNVRRTGLSAPKGNARISDQFQNGNPSIEIATATIDEWRVTV
jgi:hypothetical protein